MIVSISKNEYMSILFKMKKVSKKHNIDVDIPRMSSDRVYATATLLMAESVTSDLELLSLCQSVRDYMGISEDAR